MRLPHLLRDVRRRHGLSIRAAALRCGVPRSTWADWESGTTAPSVERLDEVLRELGLDLRLIDRAGEPPGESAVVRHLRRSLTARATAALGDQLDRVVAVSVAEPRVLTGPAAMGVWVPYAVARAPLPLPRARPGDSGRVEIRLPSNDGVPRARLLVPTPNELVSQGHGDAWPLLLISARLLADRARDAARRRLPAHRDPNEERELSDLLYTLEWGGRGARLVSSLDSRAWRLDAPATLDEALARQGLPPRNASRRGGVRRGGGP